MKSIRIYLPFLFLFFTYSLAAQSSDKVVVVPIQGDIDNGLVKLVERSIADAEEMGAIGIILHMDTYGGLLNAGDEIRTSFLNTEIPTIAFIDKNAASAGALIALSCDEIVMTSGSSMGAATAVQGQTGEKAPEKIQSYMRGMMRSTAESNGRDPRYAEAMVDETLEIEGVIEEGKLLTFSSSEALKYNYADTVLASLNQVMEWKGWEQAEKVNVEERWEESVLRFLSSPVMSSLLMLMMLGGLYFELQSPGVGFPGAISAVGAMLFFAPLYIMGLAQSWEIVLFVIGVILIAIEIFVIPGFGLAGFAGISLVIFSLGAALIGNIGLSFPEFDIISRAIWTMVVTLLLSIALVYSLSQYLPNNSRFNRLILATSMGPGSAMDLEGETLSLVGQIGTALSPLRPSGTIKVGDQRIDVVSDGDFIDRGEAVKIVSAVGNRVVVSRNG